MLVLFEGRQRNTLDRDPVPEADVLDLDTDAIADYRRERARAHPGATELAWSDEEMLVAIGAAVRRADRIVPTVAGVLLFGSRPLLRRLFPMVRLDYIRATGTEWVEDPERRFESIDMRDPIIRLIRRGEAAILDDLPKRFHLPPGELQRRDVPRIPERVIREAIVNALMHRSYRKQGPTQIIRYSNRIEIRNPGHSLKAEDRLGEPGSETRIPAIAAVLHETDFAETKGSGIRIMRRLMREMDLAPPAFGSDRGADEFVATLFLHNLLDDADFDWLANFAEMNLSADEARALVHVREVGRITNAEYRELNGVQTLDASAHLRRLRDLGLIEQHDHGAATYYTPTDRLLRPDAAAGRSGVEPIAETSAEGSEKAMEFDEEPSKLDEKSSRLGEKPTKLGEKSTKLDEKPIGLEEKPIGLEEVPHEYGLPSDLSAELASLNRWTPQPKLRVLIRRLCVWRPLSAEDLSHLLGRSKIYLQSAYIGPMVQAGEIEYTNPTRPSDPNQRYRAAVLEEG